MARLTSLGGLVLGLVQIATLGMLAATLRSLLVVKALLSGACPVVVLGAILAAGCASAPSALDLMERDIQNCILAGGHPHLGPNSSVLCAE